MQHGRDPVRHPLALCAAVALASCGTSIPSGDAGVADAASVECEVGTGVDGFVPIEPGDEVMLIAGPQGGYHVFTSVRLRGIALRDSLRVTVTLRRASDGQYLGPTVTVGSRLFAESDEGWSEVSGLLSIVNDPSEARGEEVIVRVTVSQDEGAELHADERGFIVR